MDPVFFINVVFNQSISNSRDVRKKRVSISIGQNLFESWLIFAHSTSRLAARICTYNVEAKYTWRLQWNCVDFATHRFTNERGRAWEKEGEKLRNKIVASGWTAIPWHILSNSTTLLTSSQENRSFTSLVACVLQFHSIFISIVQYQTEWNGFVHWTLKIYWQDKTQRQNIVVANVERAKGTKL